MTSKGDFHLHSTAADGVHTPTWVMETAAANGVRALSLTDHDSTEGLAEAQAAADQLGLRLIPGMELSVDLGKADVHLLGYGIDVSARPLQEFLAWQREGRLGRTRKIVEILAANGMPIRIERVLEIAGEATGGRTSLGHCSKRATSAVSRRRSISGSGTESPPMSTGRNWNRGRQLRSCT